MLTDYLRNDIPVLPKLSNWFSSAACVENQWSSAQGSSIWSSALAIGRGVGRGKFHEQRRLAGYSPWVTNNWTQLSTAHSTAPAEETALLPKEAMITLRVEWESTEIHYSNSPITARTSKILFFWSIIYLANIWSLYIAACRNILTKCISLCKLDVPIYRRRWDYMRKFKIRTKFDIIIYTIKADIFKCRRVYRINYHRACFQFFIPWNILSI